VRFRTPAQFQSGDTRPNATWYDLEQLAFAVVLFELVIAALAVATRAFFGVRTAIWVGLGIGALVFLGFVLISLLGVLIHSVASLLARREARYQRDGNAAG
jgi:hypothetical protein